MMTMKIDMTAELAAIPYGLAIALGISFVGIVMSVSRHEIRSAAASLVVAYQRCREALRGRHIPLARPLPTVSGY